MLTKIQSLFKNTWGKGILYFCTFIFILLLVTNNLGLELRERITIESTLDFSWFVDAIERLLHGYLLGRDTMFTYGPLFQVIYALPSILFQLPSYISVALSPIVSLPIQFALILYIARNITKNIYEQIAYILLLFIGLGLVIANASDTIRMLVPLAFGIYIFKSLYKKHTKKRLLLLVLIPSLVGLYAYNLFVTCTLLLLLSVAVKYLTSKSKSLYKNSYIWILPGIFFVHLLTSFALTQNLDYIYASMDTIVNYRYPLSLTWAHDRNNVLVLFPIGLLVLGYALWFVKTVSYSQKNILGVLLVVALINLMYAVSRSDAGHIMLAIYPSIIVFFTILFILALQFRALLIVALLFYSIVPYKPTFYNTLAPKNVFKVYQMIVEKPAFFNVYKLAVGDYTTQQEVASIVKIVQQYEGKVLIYPYDSYILNSIGTTYNTYALGTYISSNTFIEQRTVNKLVSNPPGVIILAVDTKGALHLDDIPNFTRNPLIAQWMIKNYQVIKKEKKYLVLKYNPDKKNISFCPAYTVAFSLKGKETVLEKISSFIKPPVYYFGEDRLPYIPSNNTYYIFPKVTTVEGLAALFEEKITNCPALNNQSFKLMRVSPFIHGKREIIFERKEFNLDYIRQN